MSADEENLVSLQRQCSLFYNMWYFPAVAHGHLDGDMCKVCWYGNVYVLSYQIKQNKRWVESLSWNDTNKHNVHLLHYFNNVFIPGRIQKAGSHGRISLLPCVRKCKCSSIFMAILLFVVFCYNCSKVMLAQYFQRDHKFLTRTVSVLITFDNVFRLYINTDLQRGTASNLYGHYVDWTADSVLSKP